MGKGSELGRVALWRPVRTKSVERQFSQVVVSREERGRSCGQRKVPIRFW